MGQYRKKPVVIEAIQFTADNANEILDFIGNAREATIEDENGIVTGIIIKTPEGDHKASLMDFIIKGIRGEFYPCKPDIFEATYERADDDNA